MANSGSFNTNGYQGRYLTFSWSVSSQSIESNSSTISWSLKGAGNASSSWYNAGNFKVVINGVTVYSSSTRIKLYNGTVVASGNLTIAHGSDGTKTFSASAQAGIYYVAVNCTGSGSWSLPTISRQATLTSAPNFTDEQNPKIIYSNSAGSLVTSLQACISLTGSTDNIAYRDIPKNGTEYTFNLTTAERNILRSASPNSNTLSVIFYVKTVISGQTYYSTLTRTLTIVNANPTISGGSYRDTNSATIAITGNNQQIIQNNSTVAFTFGSLAAQKYATLRSIEITVNAVTVTTTLSGSSLSNTTITFGAINSSSNLSASIKLTDSRGNVSTATIALTILAWSLPTAIINCIRKNNYYSDTDLTVNADYSSLGGKNTITIQYQTKESDGGSWSALQSLQDNVTETIDLDNTEAWDIKVIVTDRLGSTTYNLSIDRGIPIVYFDRLKRAVGINCFPSEDTIDLEANAIKLSEGFFSFEAVGINGTAGYARVATIKITGNYSNAPIKFEIFRRGAKRSEVMFLCFNNDNSDDPSINGLFTSGSAPLFNAFATKTDTSTWEIYVQKSESWDSITVITTIPDYMRSRVKISYADNLLSDVPSGATMLTAD